MVRISSDHAPILLRPTAATLGNHNSNKPFRFETFWLSIAGFDDLVQQWWSSSPTSQDPITAAILKLRHLRSQLRTWNQKKVGNILNKKEELKQQIKHLDVEEERRP